MNTEIKNAVYTSGIKARYDTQVKRILANKRILAHILVKTIEEFHGMNPKDVEQYIESEVYIGKVPIEPGVTNEGLPECGDRIVGMNSENQELNEGLIRFDIIFYVRMKDGLSQIIVNIEAQKDEPYIYDILNRAIFYGCRMISSQKERDFKGQNFNDIKQVYTIWICMELKESVLNHFYLTDHQLMGEHTWKGRLDLLNIVMIGLPKELPERDEEHEMHRLLTTLLSKNLSESEKTGILEREYDIPADSEIGKEINIMCNLSEGVFEDGLKCGIERGIEQGIERGIERGIEQGIEQGRDESIIKMYHHGIDIPEIAAIMNLSIDKVKEIVRS